MSDGIAAGWPEPVLAQHEYEAATQVWLSAAVRTCARASGGIYGDVLNDMLSVDIVPQVTLADERTALWRPSGPGARLLPRVNYPEQLDGRLAEGRRVDLDDANLAPWVRLALTCIARDRHEHAALRHLLDRSQESVEP